MRSKIDIPHRLQYLIVCLFFLTVIAVAACSGEEGTPTVDPDIYNQVPDTTVFEPDQCMAILDETAPAFPSNSLTSGQPRGDIPSGEYEVGVVADYGSSVWYALNGVSTTSYINSASVSSFKGDCELE